MFGLNYFFIFLIIGLTACLDEDEQLGNALHKPINFRQNTSINSANILFEETFEGKAPFSAAHKLQIGSWGYALQYVTSPVYKGTKSARFELRDTDLKVSNGTRTEAYIIKNLAQEKVRWYSFAAYFPTDGYAYDSENEVINQWHQSGTPATSLRIRKDRFYLQVGNDPAKRAQIDLGPVIKDIWHEFVFRFLHSHADDGLIEVWHNGNKILTYKGGNMYDITKMPNIGKVDFRFPNWKIGIYKPNWNNGSTDTNRRVVFYDNIRVGNERATLSEMSSVNIIPPLKIDSKDSSSQINRTSFIQFQ